MAWITCPNEICGEKFALSDDTEAFARAHEGLRLVCPFGHAIWPFPDPMKDAEEAPKPKETRSKRILPISEEQNAELGETGKTTLEYVVRPTTQEGLTETASAFHAEAERAMSDYVEPASEASLAPKDSSPEKASEPTPAGQDADPVDLVTGGEPNENEIYMLVGDDWIFDPRCGDERRATYKNGEIFRDAERDKGHKIYEDHAPEGVAQTDTPDEATELPAELQALITATETVESWPEVKDAMGTFQKGTLWPTLTIDQQNHVRASAWDTLVERAPAWLPDHGHDLSAFRLWVEAQTDPALIRADLALLQADPAAQAKVGALQSVTDAAQARIKALA